MQVNILCEVCFDFFAWAIGHLCLGECSQIVECWVFNLLAQVFGDLGFLLSLCELLFELLDLSIQVAVLVSKLFHVETLFNIRGF